MWGLILGVATRFGYKSGADLAGLGDELLDAWGVRLRLRCCRLRW